MLGLVWRNLVQGKGRLMLAAGGVATALLLILALDAVFVGAEAQLTAYIDHSRADVIVSQSGVRTMHMSSSTLPAATVDEVQAVAGVGSVTPVRYAEDTIVVGGEPSLAYIIGLLPDAEAGAPWQIAEGVAIPGPGEAVIDVGIATKARVGLGDPVTILGRDFTIAGLAEGTVSIVNSMAVIPFDDLGDLLGISKVISYLFVRVAPDVSAPEVATTIGATVEGITVQTREEFASQERAFARDMGADTVAIMNLLGFVTGLAVLALAVYTATLARRREFGVLKAIGARNGDLYRAVLTQSLITVIVAFIAAFVMTLALTAVVPRVSPTLALQVSIASLVRVASLSVVIAAAAAILPIRQIAGLDPAMVFRGR